MLSHFYIFSYVERKFGIFFVKYRVLFRTFSQLSVDGIMFVWLFLKRCLFAVQKIIKWGV